MKAVNLIPAEARRGGGGAIGRSGGAVYLIIGLLAAALVLAVVGVLTTNTVNERKAKLATLQAEASQAQASAAKLAPYTTFANLAQARAAAVASIAAQRFDWHQALADLAKAVPANTTLQSLNGAPPAASPTGVPAATTATGTTQMNFALGGCTASQNDVALLLSRLRLMNGVTSVTLQSSSEGATSGAAGAVAAGSSNCHPPQNFSFAMTVSYGGASAPAVAATTGTATPTAATTAPGSTVPAAGHTAATQATTTGAVK